MCTKHKFYSNLKKNKLFELKYKYKVVKIYKNDVFYKIDHFL